MWNANPPISLNAKEYEMKRSTFTLIELLMVIGIILILMSILLPALKQARETAKRGMCMSQEKQIVAAFMLYASDNNEWLPTCYAWGTPVAVWNGSTVKEYLGIKTNEKISVLTCPSHLKVDPADRAFYSSSMNFIHMTYLYGGGIATNNADGTYNHDVNDWYGWHVGNSTWMNRYTDKSQPGPLPRMTMRNCLSRTGIIFDRMWTYGGTYHPNSWDDRVGTIAPNHRKTNGSCAGGNITFADGHAQWVDINSGEPKLHTYYYDISY